ncbi:Ig-like domain-containing protein [Candidatus Neomarinimicrobiota bacterium]
MIKRGFLLGFYLLITLLLFTCTTDKSTIIGPTISADNFLTIESFQSSKSILYTGVDSCIVQIKALDLDKKPAKNLLVKFSAQIGSITASETTDTSGIATAMYYSGSTAGLDSIIAQTGLKSDTLILILLPVPEGSEPGDDLEIPASIALVPGQTSILADGVSATELTATVSSASGNTIAGLTVELSTNLGLLTEQSGITGADGTFTTMLKSIVSASDRVASLTATVSGTEISRVATVAFLGINADVQVDSAGVSSDGYYRALVKTRLFESTTGKPLESSAAKFESSVGSMLPEIAQVDQNGEAFSVLTADIKTIDQFGITVTGAHSSALSISDQSSELIIPGVTLLVSTLDDTLVGDGASFTQIRATLRTSGEGAALGGMNIQWATSAGTIKPYSKTNALGETLDTLRTDLVGSNTVATFQGSFGSHVADEKQVTFLKPQSKTLLLGWAPAESSIVGEHELAEGVGLLIVTAIFADENANPIYGEVITFWLSENYIGAIDEKATINEPGEAPTAQTRLFYPEQYVGSVVRVWARVNTDQNIRGYIDITLPDIEGEEEEG